MSADIDRRGIDLLSTAPRILANMSDPDPADDANASIERRRQHRPSDEVVKRW